MDRSDRACGFARVVFGFGVIAFGVPIDGEIAISESERIFTHGIFHQMQTFQEFAFVDGHLAEAVKRNGPR